MQKGTTYHVALTYDGSTIRLFLNGTLKTSTSATGTIHQLACEDFLLGPLASGWLEASFNNSMTNGWVDRSESLRSLDTANFTAPTAKETYDGNTMPLFELRQQLRSVYSCYDVRWTGVFVLRRLGNSYGQVSFLDFRDLSLIGTGPYAIYMVNSRIENVTSTAYWRGIQLLNNDYLNRLTSVKVIGASNTLFRTWNRARGWRSHDERHFIDGGTLSIFPGHRQRSHQWTVGGTEQRDGNWRGLQRLRELLAGAESSGLQRGNESVYQSSRLGIRKHGKCCAERRSHRNVERRAPHIAVHGGTSIVHIGGNYSLVGAAPSTIYRIYAAPTNKVQLVAPLQQWMNVPWADNTSAVAVLMGNDPAASKGVPNGYASLDANGTGAEYSDQRDKVFPGNLGGTTPAAGTFSALKCQSFAGARCADAYSGADWGAKVNAAIADLPSGGGIVDARALTGSRSSTQIW